MQLTTAVLNVQCATRAISALNCGWLRAGILYDPHQRAAALARHLQSSRSLDHAKGNLAVLQRAHAISLYTELNSIMKRKGLRAAALQQLRERSQLRSLAHQLTQL
jgi:hypothetical protein